MLDPCGTRSFQHGRIGHAGQAAQSRDTPGDPERRLHLTLPATQMPFKGGRAGCRLRAQKSHTRLRAQRQQRERHLLFGKPAGCRHRMGGRQQPVLVRATAHGLALLLGRRIVRVAANEWISRRDIAISRMKSMRRGGRSWGLPARTQIVMAREFVATAYERATQMGQTPFCNCRIRFTWVRRIRGE